MPIATLDTVKLMLGITGTTDDTLLNALRDAADEFLPRHCGRGFCGGSFTEDHAGRGRMVFLRQFPVATVTSVKVDSRRAFGPETALEPDLYYVHPDRGVVVSLGGPFAGGPGTVRVAYTVATDQVPAAVVRAYAELVGHWYRQAKTAAATGQTNVLTACDTGTGMETKYPWGQAGGFKVPAGVVELLRPYRVPAA
jgi:hypothetical protein